MKTEQEILRICDNLLSRYTNYDLETQNANCKITIEDFTMLRTLIHVLVDNRDDAIEEIN